MFQGREPWRVNTCPQIRKDNKTRTLAGLTSLLTKLVSQTPLQSWLKKNRSAHKSSQSLWPLLNLWSSFLQRPQTSRKRTDLPNKLPKSRTETFFRDNLSNSWQQNSKSKPLKSNNQPRLKPLRIFSQHREFASSNLKQQPIRMSNYLRVNFSCCSSCSKHSRKKKQDLPLWRTNNSRFITWKDS